jgi:hypothetical protein
VRNREVAVVGAVVLIAVAAAAGAMALRKEDARPARHEVVLLPGRDTYVSQAKPDDSYGTAAELRADSAPNTVRTYLHFDVTTIDGRLVGVRLRLHANAPDRTGLLVAPVQAGTWTESITWRSAPRIGEPVWQGQPVEADEWAEIDLSSVVKQPGRVDIALVSSGKRMVNYSSRDAGESTAPQLVLVTER